MQPFYAASTHQFPSCFYDFMNSSDLLELCCTTHAIRPALHALALQKEKMVTRLLCYFYDCHSTPHGIRIKRRYDTDDEANVRALFLILPEVFHFIEQQPIRFLDWGIITDYGGHSAHLLDYVSSSNISYVKSELLRLLAANTTLEYCNVGVFLHTISCKELEDAVSCHPCLQSISLLSNGASYKFNGPPTTLRRTPDGTFSWRKF